MRNYQLYRTNVLLGGQMQLDLVLGKKDNKYLKVNNAHISPISSYVPFTYSPDENIFLYKHQDNIREYYKKIEGSFYQTFLTPELTHDWPIVVEDEEKKKETKIYNDTYIYGCRRLPYGRYNEEFGVLVPLWIEEVDNEIRFEINLYNTEANNTKPFATKILSVNKNSNDEFSQYFFKYLEDMSLLKTDSSDKTNDNVINITFNKSAYVHGLECTSGNLVTKDISQLAFNITSRERPLMEVDNMIINSFKDNHMICKQLINFNLCFSLEDFISAGIFADDFYGIQLRASVDIYVDDVLLEKRDFFNNYEYIDNQEICKKGGNINTIIIRNNHGSNVLDYLEDYNCLDLINKNKLTQNIIHWSLNGQNDYLFNAYGGFQGHYAFSDAVGDTIYDYETYSVDLDGKYPQALTNANWLNFVSTQEIQNIELDKDDFDGIEKYSKYAKLSTKFDFDLVDSVLHGIKYRGFEDQDEDEEESLLPVYEYGREIKTVYLFAVLGDISAASILDFDVNGNRVRICDITSKLTKYDFDENNTGSRYRQYLYPFRYSKIYAICVEDPKSLYFHDFMEAFKLAFKLEIDELPVLKTLYNLFLTATEPTTISFTKSLEKYFNDSPDVKTREFQYCKQDSGVNKHINRYDGKICPTFLTPVNKPDFSNYGQNQNPGWKINNRLYYKDIFTRPEFALSNFKKYGGTKYPPLYKSVGYYAIKFVDMWKEFYVNNPEQNYSELNLASEYPWYDQSKIMYVKPEHNFVLKNKDSRKINIKDAIISELMDIYCKDYTDEDRAWEVAENIYNMYNIKTDWEYSSTENIYIYDYIVNMILK